MTANQHMPIQTKVSCVYHPTRRAQVKCNHCGKMICLECARWVKQENSNLSNNWCKACYYRRPIERRDLPKIQHAVAARTENRPTWRIDWVGSFIGTVILTASVAVAGPVGFAIGIGLWWIILSLRR